MTGAPDANNGAPSNVASPPNKRDLKSWWKGFKLPSKHQEPQGTAPSACASLSRSSTFVAQPIFSEDVWELVDTSLHPLEYVLRLQDARTARHRPVVSSDGADRPYTPHTPDPHALMRLVSRHPRAKQDESPDHRPQGIFGVPLRQSITYANVAISLIDENGKSYIYGYVPIVVAKCGVFLKEKGEYRFAVRARPSIDCQS